MSRSLKKGPYVHPKLLKKLSKIKIGDKKYPRISLDLSSIRVKGKKDE